MTKYIPHGLSLLMAGYTIYSQTWLNFALFTVLMAYAVYTEVLAKLTFKNDLKAEIARVEANYEIMNERTLNLQSNVTQIRMSRGLK
jgi:hypothetical protein